MLIRGIIAILLFSLSPLSAIDWKPVNREELEAKTPLIEKDAHAETLLWEVWVTDEASNGSPHSVLTHYLRMKVYDQRGVEMMSKVDIPYFKRVVVSDIAGRVIKPDGTIIDLKKDSIFDRELVKGSGLKLKVRSLAFPGVEPGAIVEYRWRERQEDHLANYLELDMQRDTPIRSLVFHLKPLTHPYFPYGMRTRTSNVLADVKPVPEPNGFWAVTYSNIPSFREEPRMPPEKEVKSWMLVYYAEDKKLTPEKYWKDRGKSLASDMKPRMKANDDVKRMAASLVEGAASDEEKVAKLFQFCRTSVKNVNDEGSGLTAAERRDRKENKSPADTLKAKMGTGLDIDLLFAALATGAGYDARIVLGSDRSHLFFRPEWADSHYLPTFDIAVRLKDGWHYYDPASTYLPCGMLRWQEEGTFALIADPKEPEMVKTPLSPPEKSIRSRQANLKLQEDGAIEGAVHLEYTGHAATVRRSEAQSSKAEEREEQFRSELKEQYGEGEFTDIRFTNMTDTDKPLVIDYHVRIPAYAQRTGKRLFVQADYFQKNVPAVFTTSERKHPVYFNYPWMERDRIIIEAPANWDLDHPDIPGATSFGEVGHYEVKASWSAQTRQLLYNRELRFGGNELIFFPVDSYKIIKQAFDLVHTNDSHVLSFRQAAPRASN